MVDRVDEEKRLKWGFDFRAGRPVDGGGGSGGGEGRSRYEWFPVADTDCVPSTYRRIGESWAHGGADADNGPLDECIIQGGSVTGSFSLACSELATAVADGGTSDDGSIVSSANPRVGPDISEMNVIGEIGENSNAGSDESLRCLYCGTCDEGTPNDSFHVNPRSSGTFESERFKAKDSSDADDCGFPML